MKRHPHRLISKAEAAFFAVAFATLMLSLVISLFLAQRQLVSTARYWDFLRVERYMKLCQMALESQARAMPSEESLQKLRDIGLYLDVYPADHEIPQPNPRFVQAIESVEMWGYVRDPEGKPAAVIRISRHDINTRHTLKTVRLYTAMAAAGGLLLIAVGGFVLRKTIIKSLSKVSREIKTRLPASASGAAQDPLEELEGNVRALIDSQEYRSARSQKLLDNHTEMVCLSSPEGTIIDINNAYCGFFGKQRENLVGSNYLDLIPPSERTDALASVQKLSRAKPENFTEHRVLLTDGSTRWVRWRDTAVFGDNGTIKEILSYGTDISREKNLTGRIDSLKVAFAQMQSLAETGSLTWDFGRDVMEWTTETRRLLGAKDTAPASLQALLEAIAPDDREAVRRLFLAAREEGKDFQHEFHAVWPDGSWRVLQGRAEVLADPKTKILNQLTCTLRDISSLRDAEASIRRELRFREAIETSLAAGIVVSDDQGRNLFVNPAFCEMTGWTKDELVGVSAPYPYWPDEEIPEILNAFDSALAGQTPAQGYELRFCRKDGTRFDVLIKVAPLLDSDDKRLGWLAVVSDISSIQQTRRELQATYERLRIAQDVAEFGIWDWNPLSNSLHWDRQSFALFGHPDATNAHEVWSKIHSEETQEQLTYELERLIAAGGKSGQDRIHARWPDGTIHEILSTYVVIRDEAGTAVRVLGVNRDITAEVEEERELRNANERLAVALEGGQFGTFEHIVGLGDVNWNAANYEINGIDPSIDDPGKLFAAWKQGAGTFFPELMARMEGLPVDENHLTYEFTARPPGREPRRVRTSVFIERNKQGHPVRLVGITRRAD